MRSRKNTLQTFNQKVFYDKSFKNPSYFDSSKIWEVNSYFGYAEGNLNINLLTIKKIQPINSLIGAQFDLNGHDSPYELISLLTGKMKIIKTDCYASLTMTLIMKGLCVGRGLVGGKPPTNPLPTRIYRKASHCKRSAAISKFLSDTTELIYSFSKVGRKITWNNGIALGYQKTSISKLNYGYFNYSEDETIYPKM